MKNNAWNSKVRAVIALQLIIVIYTFTGIMAKMASKYTFMSKEFIVYYSIEIVILGIYAVVWQQIIKKFDISVAYANRAMALVWSLLWSVIFFKESINLKNIIGVLIIILGIIMVNRDE